MAHMFRGKKAWISICCLVVVAAVCSFVAYAVRTYPSARYYSAIITKIGAPPGFTANPQRDDFRDRGIGENADGRRAYDGQASPDEIKQAMIERMKQAGFANAAWREGDPALHQSPGVLATCRGTAVFVRIYQPNDDPIDIEVYQGGSGTQGPLCPWL
jgi:hypothetical protein